MTKRRTGEPWMPAARYANELDGLTLNLLVSDIEAAVAFALEVLAARVVYADPDFAVLAHGSARWMLHADHTYDSHPIHPILSGGARRGIGTEIRLHRHDPDAAEARARASGATVIQSTVDKPHGLRECFISDPDGYIWALDRPTEKQA